MKLDEIMDYTTVEGPIRVMLFEDDEPIILFDGYVDELDQCASYMLKDVAYMYASKDEYGTAVMCFELEN